ncbi:MAG: exosortase-dependent surface protein XDP2 [Cyanobacteriota bacterium]|nr:exosortase-dependent surface protein XDP2 [Cyanobacteriota bacterium]
MKTQLFATFATALAMTAAFAPSAQAVGFGFKTNYTAEFEGSDKSKGNIMLDSVEFGDKTITEFSLVEDVNIVTNDVFTGGNSGAASIDKGDLADGFKQENLRAGNAEDAAKIASTLGNLNLNNIIDTEGGGSFAMDVMFAEAVDNLLIWERGKNSQLGVQAINHKGNLVGNFIELPRSNNWTDAGYSINTMEIGGSQAVASIGLSLADFGLSQDDSIFGYRMTSKSNYGGPDWKILGTTDATPASVPEPTAVLGLTLVAGSFAASRRRQASK